MILKNQWVNDNELENNMQIIHGSYQIIHNSLSFLKVCARRVPKLLPKEHNHNHLAICQHSAALLTKMKLEKNCHWRWNAGPSLWTGKQTPDYGRETHRIASQIKIQNSILHKQCDVHIILAFTMANTVTFCGEVLKSACYRDAVGQAEAYSSNQTRPIVSTQFKHFRNWILRYWIILHIV